MVCDHFWCFDGGKAHGRRNQGSFPTRTHRSSSTAAGPTAVRDPCTTVWCVRSGEEGAALWRTLAVGAQPSQIIAAAEEYGRTASLADADLFRAVAAGFDTGV
jgi:hypothetical protein